MMTTTRKFSLFLLSIFLLVLLLLPQKSVVAAADERPLQNHSEEQSPRFLVHLLDYVAVDYGASVKNGKVTLLSEYREQAEFVERARTLFVQLYATTTKGLDKSGIDELAKLVADKADGKKVAEKARLLSAKVALDFNVSTMPEALPSFKNAKVLFEKNCIACHGANGFGDGPSSHDLNPPPRNFHDDQRMSKINVAHVFNTIKLGVPNTGMSGFYELKNDDIWDLAFYVFTFRYKSSLLSSMEKRHFPVLNESEIVSLSEDDLVAKYLPQGNKNDRYLFLGSIRFINNVKNDGDGSNSNNSIVDRSRFSVREHLNKATQKLNLARDLILKGPENAKSAITLSMEAYLDGIEPLEPVIKVHRPNLTSQIEEDLSHLRQEMEKIASGEKVGDSFNLAYSKVTATIHEIAQIEDDKNLDNLVVFTGAFTIILREGLEAVLILITLLSIINSLGKNYESAKRYTHAGWISALVVGAILWSAVHYFINFSGMNREVLEASTSLIAVFILLYFGLWLHRFSEVRQWTKMIKNNLQESLNKKSLWGIFFLSFIAVFRETLETILFTEALWLEADATKRLYIFLGLVSAMIVIILIAQLMIKYSKKMPLARLFKFSSYMTIAIAVVLAGKGAHSLQEAAYLKVTHLNLPIKIDALGIFPTTETWFFQLMTFIVAVVILSRMRKLN